MRGVLAALLLVTLALSGCLRGGGGIFDRDEPVGPLDYVRGDEYTNWVIEVDAVEGFEPRPSAVSLLRERMGELVVKDSISVNVGKGLPSRETWTAEDLIALQAEFQDRETDGDTVVTWVAYVGGRMDTGDPNDLTLGVTIGHDLVVVFKEQVEDACFVNNPTGVDPTNPMDFLPCYGGEETIEQAVLVHEFGHAIGLVDRGLPMVNPHKDEAHGAHSNNEESIMYWAVEDAATLLDLNTQIPLEFDADDKADVCAAGGRC